MEGHIAEISPNNTPASKLDGRHFNSTLFVVEDGLDKGASQTDAEKWKGLLKDLHRSEGGVLATAVQEHMNKLPSDQERFQFVNGLTVGMALVRTFEQNKEAL